MAQPQERSRIIIPNVHGPEALEPMREAGKLTAECLREVGAMVAPGVTTRALDEAVRDFCMRHKGVVPAPLGYNGFPAHCCTSVNHVVAHGVPNDRPLREGDMVKLDIALRVNGWYGDTCGTFTAGWAPVRSRIIQDVARTALEVGINAAGPGKTTGDIGYAINEYVTKAGFAVVRDLCGHGIGKHFHDLPDVPNFGEPGKGTRLVPGMFITIEPMVNGGTRGIKPLADGSYVTRDRQRSAQFEHTIAITSDGVIILTL